MKIELHLHTSRYSACSIVSPKKILRHAAECGYEAVCLTEHDAVWSEAELRELRAEFPRLRIFPGVELTIQREPLGHLLVIGTSDEAYLCLAEQGGPAVLRRARQEDLLTVLAHPFRWEGAGDLLDGEELPDAIEHRTCNHDAAAGRLSEIAAGSLALRPVNAGDVHSLAMVGRFWIQTHRPVADVHQLRRAVVEGRYENAREASGDSAWA